jgi:hypothetical protein
MIRGRRKSAGFVHDEWTEWLNDLEASGAALDELDDAFAHVEALDQYDEGGAIVRMSAHERTFACGRMDHEVTADDLPEQARFLAGDLLRAYASGVEIEEIWSVRDRAHGVTLTILFPTPALSTLKKPASIKSFRRLRLMELFRAGITLLWGRPFVSSLALNHALYQRKNSHGFVKEILV